MTNIRKVREARGFSQLEFAMAIGVTPGAVSHWETGRRKPGIDDLARMSELLGCKVDDLIDKRGAHEQEAQA